MQFKRGIGVFDFIKKDLQSQIIKKLEAQFSNCLSKEFSPEKIAEEMVIYKKAICLIENNLLKWKEKLKGEY